MPIDRDAMRFDKRLLSRHLREGVISLEELNGHLAQLEDVSHLAAEAGHHEEGTVPGDEAGEDEEESEEED